MTGPDKKIGRKRHAGTASAGTISVSLRSVRPVLLYLSARGHNSNAFLKQHGVDPALLLDPEARLPHTLAIRLWQAAGELTQDANLGLHVAEGIQPGAFGALDYAVRTSKDLGAAFTQLFRYHRLLHDAAEVELKIHRDHATLSHRLPLPGAAPRGVSEYILAGWLVTSRQFSGIPWVPLKACFPHPAPADTSEYRRVFGCTLQFEHDCSELVLSREVLDLPLLKADPVLQEIVEAQVVATLSKLPKAEAITDAVRHFIAQDLSNGQPQIEQIASRLHMSARTLHRRLEQEETTFRMVVSEVRRELATYHLLERRLGIGEIAFLLGFSEASAFHRAFKRWTGHAPDYYRSLNALRIQGTESDA